MKRSDILSAVAAIGLAVGLSACQQQTERADTADGTPAADANVTVNPPDVTTINPPDVNINPPDVDAPDVNLPDPPAPTTKESTTVTVPGVGSTTTTTERR